jgi:O-antigen ligase
MTDITSERPLGPVGARVQRALSLLYTFVLSALSAIEPMVGANNEDLNPARQSALLLLLILLHLLMDRRLLITRELSLYIAFAAYMWISLIWTPSIADGMNTLLPSNNFILVSILFGSLFTYHNPRAVIMGVLFGFMVGAGTYTLISGFPFSYPDEMSYNAIASMYLFGLFMTLVYGWYSRSRLMPVLISLVIMVHIAATTSIKTNLGIVLGAAAAALTYVRTFLALLMRNIVLLAIFSAAIVYTVISHEGLLDQVSNGLDRVSQGADILERREDVSGQTSFGERADWKATGIKGWQVSPLFGNGVEAFRTDHGITSHSTPIDLLYNLGIIGFVLFYAMFGSLALRLIGLRNRRLRSLPALIFAGLVCYGFITLSGTMHYNTFLSVFFSVSVALLRRFGSPLDGAAKSDRA